MIICDKNCIATCIGKIYLHSMMSFPIVLMVYPMSHHQLYLLAVKGLASWVGWQFIHNGFKSFMKKDFHFSTITFTTYLTQKRGRGQKMDQIAKG